MWPTRVSDSEASTCSPSERGAGITLQNHGALVSEQELQVTPHRVNSPADIGGCIYLALAPPSSEPLGPFGVWPLVPHSHAIPHVVSQIKAAPFLN